MKDEYGPVDHLVRHASRWCTAATVHHPVKKFNLRN